MMPETHGVVVSQWKEDIESLITRGETFSLFSAGRKYVKVYTLLYSMKHHNFILHIDILFNRFNLKQKLGQYFKIF